MGRRGGHLPPRRHTARICRICPRRYAARLPEFTSKSTRVRPTALFNTFFERGRGSRRGGTARAPRPARPERDSMCSRRPTLGIGIAASDTRVSSRFPTASSHPFSRSSRTQRAYHPSMGYYGAPGNMAPPPVSLEAMMYGMGAPPGGGGYVDYEAMYRELQLRVYAQQQQQGGMRPSPGGSPHPHSPHQPPLPPAAPRRA